jgi:single-strand DNA-binding protein
MEIVGRVTNDAVVKQLKDERQVVNFSVAVNDYYKQKGAEKGVQTILFINCAYWVSTAICQRLTKGAIVELNGRLNINAYTGFDGEAKATLNCHVNSIKIHQAGKKIDVKPEPAKQDDLPF